MKLIPCGARRSAPAIVLSAGLALSYASESSAQPVDAATKAAARQLGEDGMQLYDKGDCAAAAEKLSRAHELVHVPTLALYAARCLEKLGRLVEASERYLDATRDVVEVGAPPAQKAAQADAERARKELVPRLPFVEIVPKPALPDAVVTLDGKPLPVAMFGVKRPIDPGSHTVEVQRAGAKTTRSFSIQEGESTRLEVAPPAGPAPPPGYPPGAVPYGYPPTYAPRYVTLPPPPPVPEMERRSTALYVVGVILIPLGAIALISGGATYALQTGGNHTIGTTTLTLGGVGFAGGIAMAVIGGRKVPVEAARRPSVSFEPLVGPTSAGLRVRF